MNGEPETQTGEIMRIQCENPEECQQAAELMEEVIAPFIQFSVLTVVVAVVFLAIYQIQTKAREEDND